jgi:anti-anti-sigma factor
MHDALFRVRSRETEGCVILVLSGELDVAGTQELQDAIEAAQQSGLPLTLDLTNLDFIDSSGIRVLLRLHNAAEAAGYRYAVIPGPPQIQRTFVLCGLDRTLTFTEAGAAAPDADPRR